MHHHLYSLIVSLGITITTCNPKVNAQPSGFPLRRPEQDLPSSLKWGIAIYTRLALFEPISYL